MTKTDTSHHYQRREVRPFPYPPSVWLFQDIGVNELICFYLKNTEEVSFVYYFLNKGLKNSNSQQGAQHRFLQKCSYGGYIF